MLKTWLNKNLSIGEKYVCLEAVVQNAEQWSFNFLFISRKGDKLIIENSGTGIEDITEITKVTGTDFPVLLSVVGKGVLIKNIGETTHEEVNLNQIFPNANADEFLFQTFQLAQTTFLSVVRRHLFDELFLAVTQSKYKIVAVFFSPLLVAIGKEKLLGEVSFYQGSCYTVQFDQQGLPEVKPVISERVVQYYHGDQAVSSNHLTAFCALVAYLDKSKNISQPAHEGLLNFVVDEQYRKRFELVAKTGLVVLLGLLILNRVLSYHYTERYAQLEVQQALATGETQESSELKKELDLKKELAALAGMAKSKPSSFYADQIAALITDEIRLTDLVLFPLTTDLSNQKTQAFDFKKINVSGKANESATISQLVKDLGNLPWVGNAVIDEIADDDGLLKFSIEIAIK